MYRLLHLVVASKHLAAVGSRVHGCDGFQDQRHVSSLQLRGEQTRPALIAFPDAHLPVFIQVNAFYSPKPSDLHGHHVGFGREVRGQRDVIAGVGEHAVVAAD